jgi:hypothetical protein
MGREAEAELVEASAPEDLAALAAKQIAPNPALKTLRKFRRRRADKECVAYYLRPKGKSAGLPFLISSTTTTQLRTRVSLAGVA